MAIAASGQGGILVRVDPNGPTARGHDEGVSGRHAGEADGRGLRVAADDLRTKRQLAKWVDLGTAFARSLPAKR